MFGLKVQDHHVQHRSPRQEVRLLGNRTAGSVLSVPDTIGVDGEHGLCFWQAGRVVDLADPRLSSAFPQVQTANTRMYRRETTAP